MGKERDEEEDEGLGFFSIGKRGTIENGFYVLRSGFFREEGEVSFSNFDRGRYEDGNFGF